MGIETVNEQIQDKIIMKNVSVPKLKEKIDLIHLYGYKIDLNAMIGMPFLSTREQLNDSIKTSEWIFDNNCNLIVFPLNIKPYTLLYHMYEKGYYEPISHWLLVEFLDKISHRNLNKITVAWYGNHEEIYEESGKRVIFPKCCDVCSEDLFDFYLRFNECSSSYKRKELIYKLINNRKCRCYNKMINALEIDEKKF